MGLYRSTDGGSTWTAVMSLSLPRTRIAIAPSNSNVAYAVIDPRIRVG